jgi:hypothetical protein
MILDILTVLFFVAGFVLLFRMIKQRRRDRRPYQAKTGRTANLTLHSIGPNEYAVIEDGNSVGRIMVAGDPHAEIWLWNCSLPGPGISSGTAANLEDALVEFRQEWKKRKIGLQLKTKGKWPRTRCPKTEDAMTKEKKTAEELAAMILQDLSNIDGCPKRGLTVTVYGLNPWNSMLTFGADAGPVPNKAELRSFCEIITERLKRLYDVYDVTP